eukprot:CAMPEP_0113310676 /NCGR_PEP_ID=MMETSP0010_2-20120614/8228_1 /TAXON_ID=216773 ORGANISM="Corethron hystrix, Strain 308" /NCGR_SAMPLE_ID=MMETSP0010_2 /ASSEMBLY_ACC=CAM_ASM_000155 /LENGTH=315 /DNA_ID=CAMNT_0000166183 /DNA_START=84 /DNA_END=1031 /DNA_ORIENTATION=+ /assembly_acc=CAM_ASM_000155
MIPAHDLLVIDPAIRDWVVIPLLLIIATSGLMRPVIQAVLKGVPAPPDPAAAAAADAEARARSAVARAHRTRMVGGHGMLTEAAYAARREYYVGDGEGEDGTKGLFRDPEKAAAASGPAADPMAALMGGGAMSGMLGQSAFMIQNMIMMNGIQHFFQGYVLLKIPFPLTNGFKSMFQRGLNLTTLDTSYVSSLSWYFLVSFGLRGFYQLCMRGWGRNYISEGMYRMLQMGVSRGGAGTPGQVFDATQLFKTEADNFEMTPFRPQVDNAEKELLGKNYPHVTSDDTENAVDEGKLYAISAKKTRAPSKPSDLKKEE